MLGFCSISTAGVPEVCELQPGPGRWNLCPRTGEGPQTRPRSSQASSDPPCWPPRSRRRRSLPTPGAASPGLARAGRCGTARE